MEENKAEIKEEIKSNPELNDYNEKHSSSIEDILDELPSF